MKVRVQLFLTLTVVLGLGATNIAAQQVNEGVAIVGDATQAGTQVDITDGAVFINGTAVSFNALPSSLDLRGVTKSFYFFGTAKPIVDINGRFFVVEESTLREATEEDMNSGLVLFADNPFDNKNPLMQEYKRELQFRAQKLQELEENAPTPSTEALVGYVDQVKENAREAAQLASQLPDVDMQAYLTNVRNTDTELYSRFVREYQMEAEALRLAAAIRHSQSSSEVKQLTEKLRETLGVIFDLKQDNRRHEIDRLTTQLSTLKRKVDEREELREKIIENRIKDLIQ